jgi:hypothetical protein
MPKLLLDYKRGVPVARPREEVQVVRDEEGGKRRQERQEKHLRVR